MPRELSGTGRLSIFPLLHDWETGSRCVLAYTSADNGYTAVVGVIPIEGNVYEPGDLFALAGRHGFIGEWKGNHEQRSGCWLVCTGHGALTVPKPGSLQVPEAAWSLDMARTVPYVTGDLLTSIVITRSVRLPMVIPTDEEAEAAEDPLSTGAAA